MFSESGDSPIDGESYDGVKVYASWGEGFDYFQSVLESLGGEFDTLAVWLGCNDAANGGSFSETYGQVYDELIEDDKKIVIFNVGRTEDQYLVPGDEGYANANMIAYNESMESWANERDNVTYINAYSESLGWALNSEDGIHYRPRPTTNIWDFIKRGILKAK